MMLRRSMCIPESRYLVEISEMILAAQMSLGFGAQGRVHGTISRREADQLPNRLACATYVSSANTYGLKFLLVVMLTWKSWFAEAKRTERVRWSRNEVAESKLNGS